MSNTAIAPSEVNVVPFNLMRSQDNRNYEVRIVPCVPGFQPHAGLELVLETEAESLKVYFSPERARELVDAVMLVTEQSEKAFTELTPEQQQELRYAILDQEEEEGELELAEIPEEQITIMTKDGPQVVAGWRWGSYLAVNKMPYAEDCPEDERPGEDEYTITHLPTGHGILDFGMTREQAIDLMLELSTLDWNATDPYKIPTETSVVAGRILAAFAEHHRLERRVVVCCAGNTRERGGVAPSEVGSPV